MKREIIKAINTVKPRNFVQQHVMMFNKSVVFADKKSMFNLLPRKYCNVTTKIF